jgi:N-acetylglutamate synthase-like GNAT family acetyltransferase
VKDFFIRRAKKDDLETVLALLQESSLPPDGVADALDNFILAEGNNFRVVGAAGLEVYGRFALLRSVVEAPGWQGYGVGRALTGEILSRARARSIEDVFLLTTTAENFSRRLDLRASTWLTFPPSSSSRRNCVARVRRLRL